MAFKRYIIIAAIALTFAILYPKIARRHKLPEINNKWFGKNALKSGETQPKDPVAINKFVVNIPDKVLNDLKQRLELARYVQPLPETQFNYGFNGDYLQKVVNYWKTSFNWRKQELQLNQFNQYITQINGIDIHFIHVKPSKPAKTVVPLMVIHGWPGSVWEYYKAIPLLIEPSNDIAFEVICPSIPGFGFSEAPHQEGFDALAAGNIFVKLMNRLGHKKFLVHGGDWGSIITKTMAQLYPDNIRGIHLTLGVNTRSGMPLIKEIIGTYFPALIFDNPQRDYKKLYPLSDRYSTLLRESGYYHIQATKPDTIGAALMDSPVGLAAYILEKFSTATDMKNLNKSDGGLTEKFTYDELLTNVMIYWVSNNVASSLRFYKESFPVMYTSGIDTIPVSPSVPVAYADFPNEISHLPKSLAYYQFPNLVQFTDMPRGGHFAAFEEPKLLTQDIQQFAKKVLDLELSAKEKPIKK